MISLTGLISQKAFGKFEMGKVISNPFATAFIKEGEGEDHEVSMANNSLDTIIKMATELKAKMGEDEKQIPAWIQDHIAKAENLISQASGNYHEYGDSNESVNEAPNTGEKIQNLNNRIKVLRDKISATKSPEQKKLFSDRLKNALQSLSNIKKDHSIKAPHRESVVNEDNTPFETLMLIRNLEQTNKLLAQDLKTSKRLPNDKKENIKKSIVVNQGLINYYKETYKNLKNNESVNEEALPKDGSTIKVSNIPVKIEYVSNKKYIGYSWKDKNNKEHYEETKTSDHSNLNSLIKTIKINLDESVNEASPCWQGYKQVGMKDKGGRQVPNCVPNESVIKEAGVPMYNAYLALSNKVRNLEDTQKELSKKYFAEKELNKKTTLLQQLKKGTEELKKWRARMVKVETDYVMNLDIDSEYSG